LLSDLIKVSMKACYNAAWLFFNSKLNTEL
jgi:hypothetical protein